MVCQQLIFIEWLGVTFWGHLGSIPIIVIRPEEQITVKKVKIGEHEHADSSARSLYKILKTAIFRFLENGGSIPIP